MKSSNLINQIAIILVIILTFIAGCVFDSKQEKNKDFKVIRTYTETDTIYEHIVDTITQYVPKYETKIFYIHDTVTTIDTVFIIQEYFSKKNYVDTIIFDIGHIIVKDTVYQNSIYSREVIKNINIPTITTNTVTYTESKPNLFSGYLMGGSVFNLDKRDSTFIELPVLGAGLGFNLKEVGTISGEFNLIERDFRVDYKYNKGRLIGNANYSIGNNRLILGVNYKLF